MEPTTLGRDPAIQLSGPWTFATDPEDAGLDEAWHEPGADWPGAREVTVPHAWQEEAAFRDYTGTAWYRRSFETREPAADERAFVRFGAVDYEATVWVNGEPVGCHRGGYLPFEVDATDAVQGGDNTVVLRVNDPADCAELPHGKQGEPWYTRVSGPWQRVDLVVVPDVRIARVRATPDLDADAVRLDLVVAAEEAVPTGLEARIEIRDDGTEIATATCSVDDGTGTITVPLPDPQYWTPETPHLYEVGVTLRDGPETLDRHVDTFGMRSIEVADGQLRLNGERIRIRGALDQGYYPETLYRPADLETYREEIETAKALGCNLLRKHIKPAHPRFLDLADQLGILVWAEPANPTVYTEASRTAVREQLFGLIDRDYNRPSVAIWSLYNEEWGIGGGDDEESLWTDRDKQEYLAELASAVRDRDPTRPICDNSGWAHVATDINDYHEYVVSPDRAAAWDDRLEELLADPAANYAMSGTDRSGDAIVISEFGTWGFPSVRRLRERYGGTPPWFGHDFLAGIRRPAGIEERFEAGPFSTMFEGLESLATAWQGREFEAVAHQIETMRERDAVAGYVLTEFTDIEWEFNGLLDYTREPKAFHEEFAAVNAPVSCWPDPEVRAVPAGYQLSADVVVANDTAQAIEATVEWKADAGHQTGRTSVRVDAVSARRLEGAVQLRAPDVNELTTMELTVALPERNVERTATITVVPDTLPPSTTLYADDQELRQALAARGHTIVADAGDADTWIATAPGSAALDFAADGGTLLVLPDRDGHMADVPAFTYRTLPERASWNLCASLVAQSELPELDPVPGWAFEGLYPFAVVTDSQPDDDVSIAYTEGWLANTGAITVSRPYGDGQVAACTLRVTAAYGDHPVATALLDRLSARLG